MKLPSIAYVVTEAKQAALRFPLALACAITAAVTAMILVDHRGDNSSLVRLLMASQIGIPALIAITLLAERRGATFSPKVRWIYQLAGIGLIAAYYFSLPEDVGTQAFTRFFQLNIGLHLLVTIIPYIRRTDPNGFWHYNESLFRRFLTGLVFSATLFGGLSIAILALDQLFGANVGDDIYPRLWIGIVFIFNTWYFLGGVPSDFGELSARNDYPPILKIFSQYILAPLVAIYLVILLVYFFKVIVTTEWPSGWIGWLVSSVAAAGLFSLLLLNPLVGRPGNRWVNTYARLFYIFLLPAIVMLLLAIYKRIAQYGVTEHRYFLTVLTIWLAFVTLYGLLSKRRSIKIIALSLCLVAFVTSFGPWGAYSVSKSSQTHRLRVMLQSNDLLVDDKLTPATHNIEEHDRREISACFTYLIDKHGLETVSPWFDDSLAARIDSIPGYGLRNRRRHFEITPEIVGYLGAGYVPVWDHSSSNVYHFARIAPEVTPNIEGYRAAVYLDMSVSSPEVFVVAGAEYRVAMSEGVPGIDITVADGTALQIPFSPLFNALRERAEGRGAYTKVDGETLTLDVEGRDFDARLLIVEIQWTDEGAVSTLRQLEAFLLMDVDE